LQEVAINCGARACLLEDLDTAGELLFASVRTVGLTASASTPEWVVQRAISFLVSRGFTEIEEVVVADEAISFAPPRPINQWFVPERAIRSACP
jgi:LytB protein